jgi:hypothetical protein
VIDYLADSDRKRELDAVHLTYNLPAIVYFLNRSQCNSITTIDVLLDTYKFINYIASPPT